MTNIANKGECTLFLLVEQQEPQWTFLAHWFAGPSLSCTYDLYRFTGVGTQ